MHSSDEKYMNRALNIAAKGESQVLPNPMVGAVIVGEGKILGEGYHARYGDIHAEAAALRDCAEPPEGATLYVTLEPCCHKGAGKHNPPCTEAIIRSGIARVVIARLDPNCRVAGRGVRILRDHGIAVTTGVLERESASLNRVYETLIREQRPYVHLKAAVSLDGFLAAADGSSKWISGSESRDRVMQFRRNSEGILTGRGTLFSDLPSLTVRERNDPIPEALQPARIFLSSRGTFPDDWMKRGGPVFLYHSGNSTDGKMENSFIHFKSVPEDSEGLSLSHILQDLHGHRIYRLLVEGGSRVYGSFIRRGLWDRLTLFVAPVLLGRGIPFSDGLDISSIASKLPLQDVSSSVSGKDLMVDGYREAFRCLPA